MRKPFFLAEKIVGIEKNVPNENLQNLATAMTNLAHLKIEHYHSEMRKSPRKNATKNEADKLHNIIVNYPKEINSVFKEVIKIYEKDLKIETNKLILTKLELAQFLIRDANEWNAKSEETKEADKLFYQALSLQEKLFGSNDDATLSLILTVANFSQKNADVEKSLPLYQKFIQLVKKKHGENSPILLPALREYASILVTVERQDEANEIIKKISDISGQIERLPEPTYDLSLRNTEDKFSALMENPKTITTYLKKMKGLYVNVLIDENGRVIEARAGTTQERDIKGKNIQEKAEKEVREWRFKPFLYEGKTRKMRGVVLYPYFIKA